MGKKPKFKPVITRVRLNPEQAVLVCPCWTGNVGSTNRKVADYCVTASRTTRTFCEFTTSGGAT